MQFQTTKATRRDPLPMLLADNYEVNSRINIPPCTICQERPQQKGKRMHFHGSDFMACPRQTYFKMTTEKDKYEGAVYSVHPMFLKDGHLHEHSILEAINGEGIKVTPMSMPGEEAQLKIPVPFFDPTVHPDAKERMTRFVTNRTAKEFVIEKRHFLIIAHVDGLGTYTDPDSGEITEFGIECKSVKDETWKKLQAGEIQDTWYGQMQIYMFLTGVPVWYLCVKNRTSSVMMTPFRIDYNVEFVIRRMVMLNKIYAFANYGRPVPIPANKKKDDYECKFCPFRSNCW